MSMNINTLITSCSKKIPLLKEVKKAVSKITTEAKIFGADTNPNCIGRYFVDEFWEMPRLDQLSLQVLINFCNTHDIGAIIPTRDGELSYFASYKQELAEHGIHVMVSDLERVQISLDKLTFFQKLTQLNYPVISTAIHAEFHSETYVVKERYGAGSQKIGLNLTKEEALNFSKRLDSPIYQPYIEGEEFSVDLYVDRKGITKGCIVRRRELVVNGESQITTTCRNLLLENRCTTLAETLDLYGHVMFQVIIDRGGQIHFVECNCRFGGASTLSVAAGLDSFYWFLLEARGEVIDSYPFKRSKKELKLIRYPEDFIL